LRQILICVYAYEYASQSRSSLFYIRENSMPRKKQLMIRTRIDLSTGETEINNAAELEDLIESDPLLAADALADMLVTYKTRMPARCDW